MLKASRLQNSKKSMLICTLPIFFFLCESIRVNCFSSLSLILTQQFGISAYMYARISSVYLLGNILFLLPAGALLDRIKSKYIAIFSTLVCACTALGMGLSTSYNELLTYSFLAGIGASPCFILAIKLSKEWFTDHHLALMTGIIVSAAMIGGIIAQAPVLFFIQHFSWRAIFISLSMIEIILFIMAFFIIKDVTIPKLQHLSIGKILQLTFNNLNQIIKTPINWIGGLYTCLLNLPITLLGAIWGQPYLVSVNKLSPDLASIVTMFLFLGVILGSPTIGYLSDRFNKRKFIMMLCSILLFFISLIIIFVKIKFIIILMAIFFLFGLASSAQSLGYTIVGENSSLDKIGITMSFIGILVMCGGAFLQPFIGFLLDNNRAISTTHNLLHYGTIDYQHAFLIFPISFLITTVLILFLGEKNNE